MCLKDGKKNYLLFRYILENIKIGDIGGNISELGIKLFINT